MKFIKWLGIIIGILILVVVIAGLVMDESLPEGGVEGEEADNLALKMEESLGKEHWHDIQYIEWTFAGLHHFLWDKHRNFARVKWENLTVFIKPGTEEGMAFRGADRIEGDDVKKMVETANAYFNNDMFWLVAPFKSFDDGAKRMLVDYDGEKRLMVTFSEGGTTPGDSYLWKLAEDGTPENYKMWTQIIPIGGVEASWSGWHEFGNGVKLSHFHDMGAMGLVISDVSTGYEYEELEYGKDPFSLFIE